MSYERLIVPAAHSDRRLDKFLVSQHKGVPKSLIARLLRKGAIRVNGRKARPEYRTVAGDEITLPSLKVEKKRPVSREFQARILKCIVYESAGFVAVDKPAGIPVHTGTGHRSGVIEALRAARPNDDLELVHRIDAETSGLVLIARDARVLRAAQENMAHGRIRRRYAAVVEGRWPKGLSLIDEPTADGKTARTRVAVRSTGRDRTLLDVELDTGRKHQIRQHLANQGHPVVGDRRYGSKASGRLMLHARELILVDGTVIRAALPGEFQAGNAKSEQRSKR